MCDCKKYDCILKDEATYNEFYNRKRVFYQGNSDENGQSRSCVSNKTVDIHYTMFYHKINIYNYTKCKIVKLYISQHFRTLEYEKANKIFYENTQKLTKIRDDDILEYGKLRELCIKTNNNNISLIKSNRKLDDIIKSKNDDIRSLKRKIKKMNKIICETTPKSDGYESDESDDDYNKNNDIKVNTDDILKKYESIKDYMMLRKISLYNILSRNGIAQGNMDEYYDKFVSLKLMRLKLAHPKRENIDNDTEFLRILMG